MKTHEADSIAEALVREIGRADRWSVVVEAWQALLNVRRMQGDWDRDAKMLDDLDEMFDPKYASVAEARVPSANNRRRSGVRIPLALRACVIARDGMNCRHCGKAVQWPADGIPWGDTMHLDHVIPVTKDGEDTLENLVVSCATCNLARSDSGLPIGEFPQKGAA